MNRGTRLAWAGAGALILILLAACSQETQPARTATPARPKKPPVTAPAEEVSMDVVVATNPLTVIGRARTFENAVTVRAVGAHGDLVAEQHVTSEGESGNSNRYRAELWLTRVPGTDLSVEAMAFSPKDGSVQALARRNVRWNVPASHIALIFPTRDCTELRAFEREVPKAPAIARLIVEALLAGPTAEEKAKGATNPFPPGSAVRSVLLKNGVLTVDFNERLRSVGGSCAATAIRESVTRTLRRLPTVKKVVITAAGSEALALQP